MMSLYSPLEESRTQIRLIHIETAVPDATINCRLKVVQLSDQPRFTAISYVCGDPTVNESILVDGHCRNVYTNLTTALRHVTHIWRSVFPDEDSNAFWIWADAICINQEDMIEKSQQIALMGSIYSQADLVLSWLGVDAFATSALTTLDQIGAAIENHTEDEFCSLRWMVHHPELCTDSPHLESRAETEDVLIKNESWADITKLFELPYWNRAWTYQETALANNLVISTGNSTLHYARMENVWNRLSKVKRLIQQGQLVRPQFIASSSVWALLGTDFHQFSDIRKISAARLRVRSLLDSRYPLNTMEGYMLSLMGRGLRATNPKDHIYALLSLTRLPLIVDYSDTKAVKDVYFEYVQGLLKAAQSTTLDYVPGELFFLHYCGAGLFENHLDLPSFAPHLPEESIRKITGKSIQGSADFGVFPTDTEGAVAKHGYLRVPGLHCDSVAAVSNAPGQSSWYDGSMLQFCKAFSVTTESKTINRLPLQTIVQTLRFDHSNNMDESTLAYAIYFVMFLLSVDASNAAEHLRSFHIEGLDAEDGGLQFNQAFIASFLPGYAGKPYDWRSILMSKQSYSNFELKMDEVIFDLTLTQKRWRFFETREGLLGLGPLKMEVRDKVSVLKGSQCPVLLRKQGEHFVHVGTCFILDLMSGEMLGGMVRSGKAAVELVEIR